MDYKQDLNKPSGPEVWTLDSTKWCRWQYFSLTSWILGPFREVQQDCLHSSENTGAIAAKVLRLKQWTLQPLVILWLRFGSKPVIKTEPLMLWRCSSKPFNGPGYKTLCKFVWILDVFSNVYFAHNLCICLHLYTLVGGFKPIEDGTSQIGSSP